MGERPSPDAPHPGERRPPRAPSCRPHSAQSQLARARTVGLVTGPHARTARTHRQWVVGPGRTPERTSCRGWESARPRTPRAKARDAPSGRPRAAPTARQASKSPRGGVLDGFPRPHPPVGERAAPSQEGGNGTGPPPPQSKPNGARDRGRTRGGARTERNEPTSAQHRDCARCAPHTNPRRRGGAGHCESASTHRHKGHAGKTRVATAPSPRNAQTAWNGVPASEDKGHPDGTARHTQCRTRGAGRGKRGRHNTRHRPQTPRTGRERRADTTRALHLPR